MIILRLFFAFIGIGAVAFGGGYAMLPLFERIIIDENNWLTMERFVDMIAISQITPGPIAINSATLIGYQVSGLVGASVSTLGVTLIPVTLILTVSKFYEAFKESKIVKGIFKGLRPALVGLISASVYSVSKNALIDYKSIIILLLVWLLLVKVKVHPILVIFISGFIGIIVY
jgi:chromate transporter